MVSVKSDQAAWAILSRQPVRLNQEQWFTVFTIKHKDKACFGGLCHRVYHFSIMLHRYQSRRAGWIIIKNIMVQVLKMPEPFAGSSIKRKHTICIEVGTFSFTAIEIE